MNDFQKRLITSIIFVGSMLAGIFISKYTLFVLFLVLNALCLWEFFLLTLKQSGDAKGNYLVAITVCLFPYLAQWAFAIDLFPEWTQSMRWLLFLSLGFMLSLLFFFMNEAVAFYKKVANTAFALLYIGIPFSLIFVLAYPEKGFYTPNVVFGIVALIWVNDTGAYLAGTAFGRIKLFPKISPKKTLEGLIGGTIASLGIAFACFHVLGILSLGQWLVVAALISLFGPIGDLVESILKREFNVKDTGAFLPGHGGFLDRFDSFIFTLPVVTAFIHFCP